MIRCVRCGHETSRRGQLHPELHRVLYLCDTLCPHCVDELHEWWMLPPSAARLAAERPSMDYSGRDVGRRRRASTRSL